MNTMIISLSNNNFLAHALAKKLNIEIGKVEIRDFPDGETYIRVDSDVKNKTILLICSLDHPNNKILTLMFMAKKLNELGAKKISLISPYLCYMRQDKEFKPGEAITSQIFAKFLSRLVNELITIDPHLHRINTLADIYSIPTITLHAKKPIAEWIQNNIDSPILIGPDEESTQWIADVAAIIDAPFVIAKKIRQGDRKVSVMIPEIADTHKTPILIDDIISTGVSMCVVIQELLARHFKKPICIAVHALFDQTAEENIVRAGAKAIISCNTIAHSTNQIDMTDILIEAIRSGHHTL